jgi:phage shock protein PspC (stress-responsive transcriptional regulator)
MEYMSRGEPRPATGGRNKHFDWNGRAVRIEWFIFTTLVALVLLVAIGWLIFSNNSTSSGESGQVDTTKYQAVFLNGGATSGSVAFTD